MRFGSVHVLSCREEQCTCSSQAAASLTAMRAPPAQHMQAQNSELGARQGVSLVEAGGCLLHGVIDAQHGFNHRRGLHARSGRECWECSDSWGALQPAHLHAAAGRGKDCLPSASLWRRRNGDVFPPGPLGDSTRSTPGRCPGRRRTGRAHCPRQTRTCAGGDSAHFGRGNAGRALLCSIAVLPCMRCTLRPHVQHLSWPRGPGPACCHSRCACCCACCPARP